MADYHDGYKAGVAAERQKQALEKARAEGRADALQLCRHKVVAATCTTCEFDYI